MDIVKISCRVAPRWTIWMYRHVCAYRVGIAAYRAHLRIVLAELQPLGDEFERVWDENTDKLYEE